MTATAPHDISLPHVYSGKVRDIYDAGDGRWVLVTSDRISAFDVVMGGQRTAVVRRAAGARLPGDLDWDKTPPPPLLPAEVVEATARRYVDAYERVSGLRFADWPGAGF